MSLSSLDIMSDIEIDTTWPLVKLHAGVRSKRLIRHDAPPSLDLAPLASLQHIRLAEIHLESSGISAIASCCPKLRSLTLDSCCFKTPNAQLLRPLAKLRELASLDIHFGPARIDDVSCCQGLRYLTGLQSLRLYLSESRWDETCAPLRLLPAAAAAALAPSLRSLDLWVAPDGDLPQSRFLVVLDQLHTLTALTGLTRLRISGEGSLTVAGMRVLAQMPSLQELSVLNFSAWPHEEPVPEGICPWHTLRIAEAGSGLVAWSWACLPLGPPLHKLQLREGEEQAEHLTVQLERDEDVAPQLSAATASIAKYAANREISLLVQGPVVYDPYPDLAVSTLRHVAISGLRELSVHFFKLPAGWAEELRHVLPDLPSLKLGGCYLNSSLVPLVYMPRLTRLELWDVVGPSREVTPALLATAAVLRSQPEPQQGGAGQQQGGAGQQHQHQQAPGSGVSNSSGSSSQWALPPAHVDRPVLTVHVHDGWMFGPEDVAEFERAVSHLPPDLRKVQVQLVADPYKCDDA